MSFRISPARYEEIKQIVCDLFSQLNISSVPIVGFEIANKLGIVVVPYSSKSQAKLTQLLSVSEDGFSTQYDGVWYIFYNDIKSYRRVNHTILHECGHAVLDHTEPSELAEAEARFFAKYASAPPVLIHRLGLKSADEVFERFDVSHEAAQYAWNYYIKWRAQMCHGYTDYELKLLQLHGEAV